MSKHSHQSPKLRHVALCCAFVLLTALLFTSLSGCEAIDEGGVVPIPQPEVDLTPTNELVIYIPSYNFLIDDIYPAIDVYKEKYPDVNVTYEFISVGEFDGSGYTTRVNAELMASMGPDIILAHTNLFPDLYKTMDTGAFLDISSIMDDDDDFHMEDYYQPVLDAGLYKGGRYIVPYSFRVPITVSLQSQLDEIGFDMSKSTDAVSFFNELARCLPKLQENWRYKYAISEFPYSMAALYYAGIDLVDYEHRKVLPDEKSFKAFCEAYKPYAKTDIPTTLESFPNGNYMGYNSLATGETLFSLSWYANSAIYNMREIKSFDQSASTVLSTIPSIDGGLNVYMEGGLAISSTSKNQLNAWNFIKVMLSEDIQQSKKYMDGPTLAYPVNKTALKNIIYYFNEVTTIYNPDNKVIKEQSLSAEEIQPFYDLLDGITGCNLPNREVYFKRLLNIMAPYFRDEKSYDECVAELKRSLQLYLDE